MIPTTAPEKAEDWKAVMEDIEKVIMPGVTHWHHPQFHAYFPTANSYPGIVADILSGAIACIGFSWIASPACTELEMVTMDWLGKMLNLPEEFLFESKGHGGGVIQVKKISQNCTKYECARELLVKLRLWQCCLPGQKLSGNTRNSILMIT